MVEVCLLPHINSLFFLCPIITFSTLRCSINFHVPCSERQPLRESNFTRDKVREENRTTFSRAANKKVKFKPHTQSRRQTTVLRQGQRTRDSSVCHMHTPPPHTHTQINTESHTVLSQLPPFCSHFIMANKSGLQPPVVLLLSPVLSFSFFSDFFST